MRASLDPLKLTVRRPVSLASVEAWTQSFDRLERLFGWRYPVFVWHDGTVAHFYHREKDFRFFKQKLTPRLTRNVRLFNRLARQFRRDVVSLKKFVRRPKLRELRRTLATVTRVYSLYLFIVGDSFLERRPDARPLRLLSEGILYEVDETVLRVARRLLRRVKLPARLASVLSITELARLAAGRSLSDEAAIAARTAGYIIFENRVITGASFLEFCERHRLLPPTIGMSGSAVVRGTPVYPGRRVGPARIVRTKADAALVRTNEILVSPMTNVTMVSAMKRAGAIVTDEGGITCHAAIVARELKKPCVVGTKTATTVFKTGDRLIVDTRRCLVRKK